MGEPADDRPTYAVGAVVRLTGLSAHVLRAWERRYRAVQPVRTPGGSRRYTEAQVHRLRLLRLAVDAGHPISELAPLDDAELERRVMESREPAASPLDQALDAVARLDAAELERLLAIPFAALGPGRFAAEIALPFLREIGRRWEVGELSVASEHLASAVLRSLLGSGLRSTPAVAARVPILFSTPQGERHEFGVLVAGLFTLGAGGNAVYLGPDLPVDELAEAAERLGAGAVVLGISALEPAASERFLRSLRRRLPASVELWVGGGPGAAPAPVDGLVRLADYRELERRVLALAARGGS